MTEMWLPLRTNALLRFLRYRDGDRTYEGRFVPLESNHSDWNGIVEYSWDFGDATPISMNLCHGTHLTDRYVQGITYSQDSYLTGDVTRLHSTL